MCFLVWLLVWWCWCGGVGAVVGAVVAPVVAAVVAPVVAGVVVVVVVGCWLLWLLLLLLLFLLLLLLSWWWSLSWFVKISGVIVIHSRLYSFSFCYGGLFGGCGYARAGRFLCIAFGVLRLVFRELSSVVGVVAVVLLNH